MHIKTAWIVLILFIGGSVFAQSGVYTQSGGRRAAGGSAIQSSSIVYSNAADTYDKEELLPAIKEIQKNIDKNPDNYTLYVSLTELHLKIKEYDAALEELIFLNNLSKNNKLNGSIKSYINNIYENFKKNCRYERNKAPVYVICAMFALIMKDNIQAEEYIRAAAESSSDIGLLKTALPVVFNSTQNIKNALAVTDKIIAKHPNEIEIRKLKAAYLMQNSNTAEAIKELSKVLELNPKDADSKYNLYKLLSAQNMNEKDIIKHIYNTDKPDWETACYETADMLLKNNDIQDAEKYADILVKKFPDNAGGYIILSEIYRRGGRLKESYAMLNKVRERADNNEAVVKYNVILAKLSDAPLKEAHSLMNTGLYQEALDVLETADPDGLYILIAKARAYYFLNKKQKALEMLNAAMSLYPDNSDVYCAFGYIYLQEKDIESAKKYVNQSLKLDPENKTAHDLSDLVNKAHADTYKNSILSALERQNYTEAERLTDEAMEINPKDSVLYYYKALIYIAQNNYAASTAVLYKSIELDKNNAPAYFYLGIAFDNLSEHKNAMTYYQKYIALAGTENFSESERLDYAKARIAKLTNRQL